MRAGSQDGHEAVWVRCDAVEKEESEEKVRCDDVQDAGCENVRNAGELKFM